MEEDRMRISLIHAALALAVGLAALLGPSVAAEENGSWLPQLSSSELAKVEDVVTGVPEGVDEQVLRAARGVLTDPGDLPELQVLVDGTKRKLPLQHTGVSIEVSGFVARVEVTQRWKNPLTKPIEAVYVFPLPENSAVDDMKIRVGDRLIESEIQRRAKARETYEQAKREGYTAALLEQERPNIFTQSIANMAPGEDIEVVIRYVQDLTYDSGEYELVFPMVVGPRFIPGTPTGQGGTGWSPDTTSVPDASRITPPIVGAGRRSGHDISIEVVIDPGLPVIDLDVPTHQVDVVESDGAMVVSLAKGDSLPNRDFVLRFRADAPEPHGALYAHKQGKSGTFSLVVQPPALDVDALLGRREVLFVIDVSGSMSGTPLGMAKDAARESIRRLRPVDTFNVITFAGQTARAFEGARPANNSNVLEALRFVDDALAGGGTYLANAVNDALSPAVQDGRDRTVVFLTDGYVGNEAEILSKIEGFVTAHGKAGRKARAFGLGVGSSVNRYLMDGIGKAGRGSTVYLTTREDPARAVDGIYRMIDHPILTDVKVEWGGLDVRDVEPAVLPDLVASRPLVLHGRYGASGAATVVVSGMANGKRVKVEVPVVLPEHEEANGSLETLWARTRIESFERELWDGEDAAVVEQITSLGLDYRIVTAYTSFVAVDRSKKVANGPTETIVQPTEAPEGVNLQAAVGSSGISAALSTTMSGASSPMVLGHGAGGMGFKGTGKGGGGAVGYGRIQGMGKIDTGGGKGVLAEKRKANVPQVRLASATVSGHVDKSVIQRVIRSKQAAFRHAYERSLRSNPALSGKVVFTWTIDKDGTVKDVKVSNDTLGDEDLVKALVRVIESMRFEATGTVVTITYPFVFSPN
jgi:Ca-activated chloride channel family protein